ncbi:MAG TPA: hypothetical protein VFE50_08310 [Cyclobacteriaceae bacterium]|nr:hypothetical protein [Cyclobacteriaceae bacterium]
MIYTRRIFLSSLIGISGGYAFAQTKQEKPPPIAGDLVKEFVIAGHGNLQKVKEMLEQQPNLLNASWDWGNGDYETAIEGAGHVGNREVAEYLLGRGARLNMFAAAMLGKIDIVRSTLTVFPDLKTSKGPHGLMLIHHATKGGEQAKEVLEYLKQIGAS